MRLENELRRHCRVVSVDEHMTSKLHSCCRQRMKQMYQRRMCRDGVMAKPTKLPHYGR